MTSRSLSVIVLLVLLGRIGFVFSQFSDYSFSSPHTQQNTSLSLEHYRNTLLGFVRDFDSSGNGGELPPHPQETPEESTTEKIPLADEFTSSIDVSSPSDTDSSLISIDDVVDSIVSINDYSQDEDIQKLKKRYEETNDQRAGVQLIDKYNHYYDYNKAYDVFQSLEHSTVKGMDTALIMNTVLNSNLITSTQGITTIENLISELRSENLLSQQDTQRYWSLLFFLRGDKTTALEYLPDYEEQDSSTLKHYVQDLERKINYAQQGMDIPKYYSDGLIALGIFQYGYPKLAEVLSLKLLHDHPNYVLPKQILGYSNITLRDWKQAQDYFLELINQDPDNSGMYYFFIGISSYRMEDYKNSILYLDQIPISERTSDVVRYKILAYNKLGESKNLARQLKSLLKYENLTPSDMLLARELLVYEPLVKGEPYEILLVERKLLENYRTVCKNQAIDVDVCALGDVADQALNTRYGESNVRIKQLIDRFPRVYLYYVLGDYFYQHGESQEAQKAFIAALSLTSDDVIKKRITAKIKQLF